MSIEQTNVVDMVLLPVESQETRLIVADHLDWSADDGRHLLLLQEKLNAYLRYIEAGELATQHPGTDGKPVTIEIVGKYRPSAEGREFLARAAKVFREAGYSLKFSLQSDAD